MKDEALKLAQPAQTQPEGETWYEAFPQCIERFVELVRADAQAEEREECAKVCDDMAYDWQKYVTTPKGTIAACAAAIRARSNT